MKTSTRSRRTRWLVFPAVALLFGGLATSDETPPDRDPLQEITARFQGPAHSRSMDRWEEYFLASAESEEVSLAFDLDRVWVVSGRLAWVQGEVDALTGNGRVSRPFAELLLWVRGEWKTLFSWMDGGTVAASRPSKAREGCSCKPCTGCSSRGSP
jgi:hypothetical protein